VDQRQAFLDAIVADPDDDTVRLVYADWLDENGTEADRDRARLIRLQIELERLDEDDDRHWRIRRGCDTLIEYRWREWTYGFRTEDHHTEFYKVAFERGFLRSEALYGEDLTDTTLDTLLDQEPVTNFFLRHIDQCPDVVAQWKHLPRVRDLSFCDTVRDVKKLLRSPLLSGLRCLNGSGVLDEDDVSLIASDPRFANLRRLDIRANSLSDRAIQTIARSGTLSRLTALDYGYNFTTVTALEILADSPLAERLACLSLWRHERYSLPPIGWRAAELLTRFPHLGDLNLLGQRISDEGAERLAASPNLEGLKRLHLGGNALGPRGVRAILTSPYLAQVEELDLSGNRPGGEWIEALAGAHSPRLRKLSLFDNQLDGEAITRLAGATGFEGLRELNLGFNPIGDRGATGLARSALLSRLRRLDLGGCQIWDPGAVALAESGMLARLNNPGRLRLRGNRYSETGARRLRERFGYDPAEH
jgi:uncharacterized protein (TIGR02996 family)